MELRHKKGVLMDTAHHLHHVGLILDAAGKEWPESYYVMITRGAENCEGSKPTSRHFTFKAFDLRTKHLPPQVDRQELLDRIMNRLGPDYYGYYRRIETNLGVVEWIHLQLDR